MLGIKWLNTGVESTYRADILQIHHIWLDFWVFFIVPGRFERSLKKHESSASDQTFCISTSFCIFTSKKVPGGRLSLKLIIIIIIIINYYYYYYYIIIIILLLFIISLL